MDGAQDRRRGSSGVAWGVLLVLLGIFLGIGLSRSGRPAEAQARDGKSASPSASPAGANPFVRVAEDVLPAVVSVEAVRFFVHPPLQPDSTGGEDSPFGKNGEIELPSSGSGFLFDRQGHILTNNHVVAGARSVRVYLADGSDYPAVLVGTDPPTDVAVLRIESRETLPVVPLGDSDDLRIGEWVAAVGNPLGVLDGSFTVGVVSAKKRHEIEIGGASPTYQDFIQTDAAINFGNSGGPLVNSRGEAVGINTAFGGPGRGIGFAVSINMAKEVARDLIAEGRVVRGYLGVSLQELDPYIVEGMRLPDGRGVLVRDVQPGTPAAAAGLESGDVIFAFDGKRVDDMSAFRLMVARTKVGRSVGVRLLRGGQEKQVAVVLAERPDFEGAPQPPPIDAPEAPALGLTLGHATEPALPDGSGEPPRVLVREVASLSLADDAGLFAGDIIESLDARRISDPDSCLMLLEAAQREGRTVVLKIFRGTEHWFTAIPPGEPDLAR